MTASFAIQLSMLFVGVVFVAVILFMKGAKE